MSSSHVDWSSSGGGFATPPLQNERHLPPPLNIVKNALHSNSTSSSQFENTAASMIDSLPLIPPLVRKKRNGNVLQNQDRDHANRKEARRITSLTPCKRLPQSEENEDDDIAISPKLTLCRLRRSHDMSSTSCTEFVPVQMVHHPSVSGVGAMNKDVHERKRKMVRPMFRRVTQDSSTDELIDIPKDVQHK